MWNMNFITNNRFDNFVTKDIVIYQIIYNYIVLKF